MSYEALVNAVNGLPDEKVNELIDYALFLKSNIVRPMAVTGDIQNSGNKDDRIPLKLTAHWGANFDIKKKLRSTQSFGDMAISPNLIFQYQNKISGGYQYTTLNYGMYFSCYPIVAGLWFRQGFKNVDALMFLVGVEYKVLKVGYSYDVTLPSKKYLKPSTGGAHEVSVQYILPCPRSSRRLRNITCPKF